MLGLTGIIGAIGIPDDQFTQSGDFKLSIAIEWIHCSPSPFVPLTTSPFAQMERTFASLSESIGAYKWRLKLLSTNYNMTLLT